MGWWSRAHRLLVVLLDQRTLAASAHRVGQELRLRLDLRVLEQLRLDVHVDAPLVHGRRVLPVSWILREVQLDVLASSRGVLDCEVFSPWVVAVGDQDRRP